MQSQELPSDDLEVHWCASVPYELYKIPIFVDLYGSDYPSTHIPVVECRDA